MEQLHDEPEPSLRPMLRLHRQRWIAWISGVPVVMVGGIIGLEYYTFVLNYLMGQEYGLLVLMEGLVFHVVLSFLGASYMRVVWTGRID